MSKRYIHIWQDTDLIKKSIDNLLSDEQNWEIIYWNYDTALEYLKMTENIESNITYDLINPDYRYILKYLAMCQILFDLNGIWINKDIILNKSLDKWIPNDISLMIELHDSNGSHDINDNIIVSYEKDNFIWNDIIDQIKMDFNNLKTKNLKKMKSILRQTWVKWISLHKDLYYGYILSTDINGFKIFNNNDAYIPLNNNIKQELNFPDFNSESIYNYNLPKKYMPDQPISKQQKSIQNSLNTKNEYNGIESNMIIGRYVDPELRNSEKSRGVAKSISKLNKNNEIGDYKEPPVVFLKRPKRTVKQILNGKNQDSIF